MPEDKSANPTSDPHMTEMYNLLLAGKSLGDFKVGELAALEYAVEKGDFDLVQKILLLETDKTLVQAAFDRAAKLGQIDIARLLVEAGADFNYHYEYDHGEGQRCPICFKEINLMEMLFCEHFVTSSLEDGEYPVFSPSENGQVDFDYEVEEIARVIRPLKEEVFKNLLVAAPEMLQPLFSNVRKYSYFYWTHNEGVIAFEWDVHNWHGDSGYDYFHRDSGFANKVSIEAFKALDWLKENYPELSQEPEDYEVEIFKFRREEKQTYKGKGPETTQVLIHRLQQEAGLTPRELSTKLYNHISDEIGEGTPEEYMHIIEQMQAAGKLPDMEEFRQTMIREYLKASKNP